MQIIRAATPAILPNGPDLLHGLLNVRGEMIPVIDIRKQLFRPRRPIAMADRIVIVRVAQYRVAIVVDQVHAVTELGLEPVDAADAIYPELDEFITAASRYQQNTILIYDIEKLIPPHDIEEIDDYLKQIEQMS